MNIENLNGKQTILWNRKGSERKTAETQFIRGEFIRKFADQSRFDNTVVSPATISGSAIMDSLQSGRTDRVSRLAVNEDGVSIMMAPEEFQIKCKEHQVSA